MTVVFCVTAAGLFVASCISYRKMLVDAGDRLLFLAYGVLICAAPDIIGRLRA